MKEKRFSNIVQGMLIAYDAHLSMVESPEVSPGILDLNYCIAGYEAWIELKTVHANEKAKIRPGQIRWTKARVAALGNVWWMCHQELSGLVCLVHGTSVHTLSTFDTWRKSCVAMVKIEELNSLLPWLVGSTVANQR